MADVLYAFSNMPTASRGWLMGSLCVCLGQCERSIGTGEGELGMCTSLLLAMERDGKT